MRGGKNMSRRIRPSKTMIILSGMVVLGAIGLHSAFSGDLEPTAAPGPTMYTLEEIYNFRVWKMSGKTFINHPGNSRFAVHDPGTPGDEEDDLVLDKDTGLIWARNANLLGGVVDAYNAVTGTRSLVLCDRMGWRIPSIEEISSLIDMSVAGSPKLPAGHPFVSVQSNNYWTDLTMGGALMDYINSLNMGDGSVPELDPTTDTAYVWPVWGGKSSGF